MTFSVGSILLLACGVALNHFRRSARQLRSEVQRLAAEEARFHEGDSRYRAIFETAPVGCVVWEPGFIIIDWNQQAEKMFGWSRADILGRNLIDTLVHEKDRAAVLQQSVSLFADGQTNHATLQHTTRDGVSIICEWHHAVLRDAEGTPIRGVSLCVDVTAHQALTRDLRTREHYQRTLLDNFPFMVWLKDTESRFLAVNQTLADIVDADTPDALVGKSDLDYFPPELAQTYRADDQEVMRGKLKKIIEEQLEVRGERRWIETGKSPVADADGRLLGTVGYARDITERKQQEAQLRELQAAAVRTQEARRYREVFDNASDAIFVLDVGPEGQMTLSGINPAAEQALGLPSAQLQGQRLDDIAHRQPGEDSGPAFADGLGHFKTCLATGMPTSYEGRLNLRPGLEADIYQIALTPLADDLGIVRIIAIASNITQRKRYEQALLERVALEERLTRLAQHVPGYLYVAKLDVDGRLSTLYSSNGLQQIYGIAPAEALADTRSVLSRIHPDDREPARQAMLASARTLALLDIQHRVLLDDGRTLWIEAKAQPTRDEDGSILWHGVSIDITERRQLEEQLHQREQMFRALAENMPDNVARWDPEGRYLYLNPVHARTLGVSMSECLGKLIPDTHEHVKAAIAQVVTTRQAVQAVQQTVPVAGAIEIHDVSLVPEFDEAGRIVSVLGLGRNMTDIYRMQEALAAREREFRSLATNLPNAVVRWDRAGRYIYVNAAYERMRHTTAAAVVGKRISEAFPDRGDNSPADVGIARVLETGEPLLIAQQPILGTNGETRIHEVLLVPERDAQGEIVSVLGVGQDVTERLQYEATLLQRAKLQEQFASVAQAVPGFLFSLRSEADNRAYFPFASAGIADLFGLQPEDIRADAAVLRARYHPDDLPRFFDAVAVSQENLTPFSMEMRVNHPAKGLRWIESRSIPHRRPDGTTEWHGLMIDITERKQMQQRMELLEHAIDLTSDAIYLINEDLRFGYANAAACRTLGYSREELLTMGPTDIDPGADAQTTRHLMDTTPLGSHVHFETRHRTRNGQLFPVELNGTHFERDGARFAITVVRDITERKRIESTLRFIADPGHDADFLTALARHLGETLGVEYVVIDRLADEPGIAETVALYARGEIAPNLRYALQDTPCDNVLGKRGCCYPCDAQALFPRDRMLVDLGVESYAGLPLWDSTGRPIGLIAVMGAAPLRDEAAVMQTLQLVAPRAAAELEQARSSALLRAREQEYRSLAENSPNPIIRYSPDGRRLYVNPAWVNVTGIPAHEAVGKRVKEIDASRLPFADDYLAQFQAALRGERRDFETVAHAVDGPRTYHLHLVPERGPDGAVTGVLSIAHDVTGIKAAQAHMSRFVANVPGFVNSFRMGPDGRFSFPFASPGIEDIYGMRPEDVIDDAVSIFQIFHPDDLDRGREALRTSARELTPFQFEFRVRRPGMAERWIEACALPEREPDGGTLWHGIQMDVTERKRVAAALAQSERESRSLAENLPDNIARWDTEGRYLYVNPTHQRTLGVAAAEVLGKTMSEVFPDGRFTAAETAIAQVVASGKAALFARQPVPNPDGGMDIHDVSMVPEFDEAGRVVSVLGLGRDMSYIYRMQDAIAAREQEFRSLAESSPDFIIRYDRDHRMRYINANLVRQLGLASADEAIGRRPIEAWPDGRYAAVDKAVAWAIETGGETSIEIIEPVEGGEARYHQVRIVPERDVAGEIVGTIAFGREITDLKRYAQSLQARAELEQRQSQFFRMAPGLFATVVQRPDGSYAMPFASPGIVELFGLRPQDVAEDLAPLAALAHPDDIEMTFRAAEESARSLTPFHVEYRIDHPQKGLRWLEVRSMPQRMADGGTRWDGFYLDITERRRIEAALATREQEFRTLAENLPVAVIRYDTEQRRRYLNPAAERMLHGSAAELLGRVPGGPTVPATAGMLAHYRGEMDKVLVTDAARELEFVLDALPFEQREHYEIRFVPEHGADGNPTGVLAIWYDISERKRMENELRRRGEEFRAAVENSPDPIFRYDREGRRLYTNKAALNLPRQPGPSLLGATPKEVRLVPDADAENILACIRAVVKTRQESQCEVGFITPEGRRHVFQSRYVPEFGPDGEVSSVLALARDITPLSALIAALHAKESRLAEAQRIAHVGSWELDIANNALNWSDEIFRIFEIDRTRFGASYEAFLDAVHPDDRDMVNQSYRASIETRSPYEIEHRLLMPDGRVKHVFERGESIFDADGRPLRSAGTVQDITERKNTEVLLEQSRALQHELLTHREETLEEERKRIARELHEELGQVLTALRMNISMLRVRYGDIMPPLLEKTQSMIGLVDRAIGSMREVVTTLRPSSLDAGIMAALEWLASDVQKHTGIECQLAIAEPLELSDERSTALFRIVQEALTNAARHAHATRVEIRLERHGQQWQVRVADNGHGFNPGGAFPRSYGLLGMRERARVLDGELNIHSTPGQGTQIQLVFPVDGDEGCAE